MTMGSFSLMNYFTKLKLTMFNILTEIVTICGRNDVTTNISMVSESNYSVLDKDNKNYTLHVNQHLGEDKINEFLESELSTLKNSFD